MFVFKPVCVCGHTLQARFSREVFGKEGKGEERRRKEEERIKNSVTWAVILSHSDNC